MKIRNTNDLGGAIKLLVYGASGVGKTVLASTAPSPLFLSSEKGLLSIKSKSLPFIVINNLEDLCTALDFCTSPACDEYKTIVIDSITDIAEIVLSNAQKDTKDGRQAYGAVGERLGDVIRSFRDLQSKHVVMISKITFVSDSVSGAMNYAPMLVGKSLTAQLPYWFDEVFCLQLASTAEGGYRYCQTSINNNYIAKDRSGRLDPVERPDLTFIFDKMLAGVTVPEKEEKETDTKTLL